MTILLLLFALGIGASSHLPSLPPLFFCLSFLPLLLLLKQFPVLKAPLALALGLTYGIASGHYYLANQLAEEWVGRELIVEGRVSDLPREDARRQLFTLVPERIYSADQEARALHDFPRSINLSSYGTLRVKTGEQWRLRAKLKRPRGFVNPGGYDYQAALLRRGTGALGYIVESRDNRILQPQPEFSLAVLRYDLQQWLMQKSQSPEKGILIALLVGDTSAVDRQHWSEMQKTGTNHLIAISGLHLGFFAILGFFVGNLLGRFVQLFWRTCPAVYAGYFLAIAFTLFYSIIAGLNIPTLRTLIMLAVVQWVLFWRRSFRARDTLLLALVLVLLYDPLAAFDIGFWLSFSAVAMLMFCFSGRIKPAANPSLAIFLWLQLKIFLQSQWVMFVGLLIPLAVLVHSVSLLAPLANLIAIPLVTFFVVPCLILAAVFYCGGGELGEAIFLRAAEWGLAWLHSWLGYLLELSPHALTPLVNLNTRAIIIALIGGLLILLPRGLGNRYLGMAAMVFALLIPRQHLPALQMLVFDVGQGTAVFLRTPNHQLLYDTGPIYSENLDAGSALIVPYLHSQGLAELDRLVVSHKDKDHAGGLAGVLAAIRVDHLLLGQRETYRPTDQSPASAVRVESCHEAAPWQWDQVSFRFIHWPLLASAKANNHSCVLLVEYQGHRILLPGDIEKDVERQLLAQDSLPSVDILLAPHHGSHSSSTPAFVARTAPRTVIYSAGYRNQHGHPHRDIVARYNGIGALAFNTAYTGALEFRWDQGELREQLAYRQFARRYWFGDEKE